MPSNDLHAAFREGAAAEAEQLRLIAETPALLEEPDDSWEGWLPLHNASRWGASQAAVSAALEAFPDAVKSASKGGYEPLHLASMGGHLEAVRAIIAVYPEGALKADNHGRTPLDEAREGSSPSHAQIVDALLALPGVAEADAAEAVLRAARAEALMKPDDDESDLTGDYSKSVMGAVVAAASRVAAAKPEDATDAAADEDGGGGEAPAEEEGVLSASGRARSPRACSARQRTRCGVRSPSRRRMRAAGRPRSSWRRSTWSAPSTSRCGSSCASASTCGCSRASLHVSEYTDKVDSARAERTPKRKRKQAIMRELHSVLSGLLLACDYEAGQRRCPSARYTDYPDFFAPLFEVTRRYKVMNPEKMRDTYGKLVYLLQDANAGGRATSSASSLVEPIKTVHSKLKECGALEMLSDEHIAAATQVVTPDPGKSRAQIQREIKQKEAAIEHLSRAYRSRALPEEELKQCLYSIGDNNAYLYQARDPVDKMIAYLKEGFAARPAAAAARARAAAASNDSRASWAARRAHASRTRTSGSTPSCCNRSRCGARSPTTCSGCGTSRRTTCCAPATSTSSATRGRACSACRPRRARRARCTSCSIRRSSGWAAGSALAHPPGRLQRAQRAHVHRQVLAGGAHPQSDPHDARSAGVVTRGPRHRQVG